jgi:hypothetical protein
MPSPPAAPYLHLHPAPPTPCDPGPPEFSYSPGYPYCFEHLVGAPPLDRTMYFTTLQPQWPGGFNASLPNCSDWTPPPSPIRPYHTSDTFSLGNLSRLSPQSHVQILRGHSSFIPELLRCKNFAVKQSSCKRSLSAYYFAQETTLSAWPTAKPWETKQSVSLAEPQPRIVLRQIYGPRTPGIQPLRDPHQQLAFDYLRLFPRHWDKNNFYDTITNTSYFPPPVLCSDTFSLGQLARSGTLIAEQVSSAYASRQLQVNLRNEWQYFIHHQSSADYCQSLGSPPITLSPNERTFSLASTGLNDVVLVMHIFQSFAPWENLSLDALLSADIGWFLVHFYGDLLTY